MALALFDLDNTLIAGDSDYLWGRFLVELGVVDAAVYARENKRFYREYNTGCLNIEEFLAFALKPLSQYKLEQLITWREQFFTNFIRPIILPLGQVTLEKHRQNGDTLVIITATNSFIASPIAQYMGVQHFLATEPEQQDGNYTGKVAGVPCFQHGKVTRLDIWRHTYNQSMDDSYFYSDSHNDLPLLTLVDNPIATDPDAILRQHALTHGWPILSFRQDGKG